MSKKKSTAVAAPVSSNPSLLNWPTDPMGLFGDLREAILVAADRVAADHEKYETFHETLVLGVNHACARHERDKADAKRELDALVKKEKEENARLEAQRKEATQVTIDKYEAEIARLKASVGE